MSTTLNTRVQSKRDTSANWTQNNPVLLDGEVIVVDTNSGDVRFKVGNGTSTYTQLPFQDEYLQNAITDVDDGLIAHEQDHSNPHQVGKDQVGLGNVDNVKQYSASNPPPYPVTSVNGDVGAVVLAASDVGAVPTSRTVNGKALSSNITLSAADVDAVPTSRTVNGKPLSSNVTLSASDVGALSTAGGTLTGNLTGRYITGTWLQATANTHSASKQNSVCVFDGSGWIYSRTLAEFANDLGIPDGAEKYSGTLPTSGWKTSGSQRYYQVSISGMTADKIIFAVPQWSNQTNQQDSWNNIVNIRSYAGYVRFYASATPSVSINYTLIYY